MNSRFTDLSLVVRTPQLHIVPSGPGRLLNEAYLAGGRVIGRKCNRLAHQLGHGPDAVSERVLQGLKPCEGSWTGKCEVGGELERNCLKLMKYTLPTETRGAQLKAFKSIVHLTTRFVGLRHVFLRCKRLRAAGVTKMCIMKLWMGVNSVADDSEWSFYLGFAASCICDEVELASLLEDCNPDDLCHISAANGEYSVIERLLIASESCDTFEPWIAVRYLGGILESRSFWTQHPHYNHQIVTKKIFKRVKQLVEDLDVESWAITHLVLRGIRGDVQGIDILTSALLNGVRIWYQQKESRPLGPLLGDFARLMALLRHPEAQHLLPRSYNTASYDYTALVGMTYQCVSAEIIVTSNSPPSSPVPTPHPVSTKSSPHPPPTDNDASRGLRPVFTAMDLMPTSRRDLVESGKGSKETEFVVSGDELDTPLPNKTPDITSEMERQVLDHAPSSRPLRTESPTVANKSDGEEILYPHIRNVPNSKSNLPFSSPSTVHQPNQRTPFDEFESSQLPKDQHLDDSRRMDELLAALGLSSTLPPTRHDALPKDPSIGGSENPSVTAYDQGNGLARSFSDSPEPLNRTGQERNGTVSATSLSREGAHLSSSRPSWSQINISNPPGLIQPNEMASTISLSPPSSISARRAHPSSNGSSLQSIHSEFLNPASSHRSLSSDSLPSVQVPHDDTRSYNPTSSTGSVSERKGPSLFGFGLPSFLGGSNSTADSRAKDDRLRKEKRERVILLGRKRINLSSSAGRDRPTSVTEEESIPYSVDGAGDGNDGEPAHRHNDTATDLAAEMLELSDDEEMERHRRLHAEEKQREQARAVLRNMLMRQNDDLFGRTQWPTRQNQIIEENSLGYH